jgi:hypothetical protein
MWYICTEEYYPASKRNGILSHTTAQMNIEDVLLNDVSSHKKTSTMGSHLYEMSTPES